MVSFQNNFKVSREASGVVYIAEDNGFLTRWGWHSAGRAACAGRPGQVRERLLFPALLLRDKAARRRRSGLAAVQESSAEK